MLMLTQQQVTLSLLKANPIDPAYTDRYTYRPAIPAQGLGVGLTTYRGDGNPLPSFTGDPLLLPCAGSPEDLLDTYWEALDAIIVLLSLSNILPHKGEWVLSWCAIGRVTWLSETVGRRSHCTLDP